MQRYALINSENIVDNIVLWDGGDSWQPPENMTCLNVEGIQCDIGSTYNGSIFIAPERTVIAQPTEPTKEELLAQLQTLTQQIQSLT